MLFVYAAVNKIIDFQNFQVQLAQSPLISSFAGVISYIVPVVEIIIAIMLSFTKFKNLALYCSLSLMAMFSAYIIIILNFSPFVPCSCGGVLDKLSWTQHLIFNLCFVLLSAIAIILWNPNYIKNNLSRSYTKFPSILIVTICSITVMITLFLLSEDMIHHRNNFTRRFPNHPVLFERDHTLSKGRYYIAGIEKGNIFLGNSLNPLEIIELDSTLKYSKTHVIAVKETNRKYRSLMVTVKYPYFYLSDGTEAFIYRGLIKNWKAEIWIDKESYFNMLVPVDSNSIAIRAVSSVNNENMLGLIKRIDTVSLSFNRKLLDKQIDGIFDTDGKLIYNSLLDKLIYVYTYRNEYLISNSSLNEKFVAHTIDTTSRANIKVAYVNSLEASKLASPARIVNKTAATYGEHLYVNSLVIGQHELKDVWDEASIIDTYNLITHAYQFSFYLYDKNGKKISEFAVDDNHIYTLSGNVVSMYKIDRKVFEKNQ